MQAHASTAGEPWLRAPDVSTGYLLAGAPATWVAAGAASTAGGGLAPPLVHCQVSGLWRLQAVPGSHVTSSQATSPHALCAWQLREPPVDLHLELGGGQWLCSGPRQYCSLKQRSPQAALN